MKIETLTVREARAQLPSILERFRNGERRTIGIGDHGRPEAVIIPIAVLEELIAERTQALQEAIGSTRAEGLTVDAEAQAIIERWTRNEISSEQMHELIKQLYVEQ